MPLLLLLLSLVVAAPAAAKDDSDALLKQADRYVLDGKTSQARGTYERALAAGAQLEGDFVHARRLGLCYLNGKPANYAKAARWLKAALRVHPDSEDVRLSLGQALAWGGRNGEAVPYYRALSKAHPGNTQYVLSLSNALMRSGDSEQAAAVLADYVQRHPGNTSLRLEYADVLLFIKKNAESEKQFQLVLKSDPANARALVGLARFDSCRGSFTQALATYDKVLARNPQNYEAAVGKAFTLMWMRRREEARALLETLAQRKPSDKEVAKALAALEAAPPEVATAPAPPPPPLPKSEEQIVVEAAMAKAEGAAARGNYVEAVHEYHRVLEHDPQNLTAKHQIARVLSWSKNYAEAEVEYEELLRATPNDQVSRREHARILSWDIKFDDSLSEYERVLKDAEATRSAGQPEQVSIYDTRLEYARVFSWAKRYDEAIAQFNLLLPEGTVREPKHKELLVERARVLAWSRHYDESIATYDQALVVAPGDFDARLGKAQATFWAGRMDQAATLLRPLLDEQPTNPQASLAMASVEDSRGHRAHALRLLDNAPKTAETQNLRSSINQRLRPVLRLRYGFENDNEIPANPLLLDSVYRAQRYTASIEFYPHPDVRMEVSNTVTATDTSNSSLARLGNAALATETFARVEFRPASWLIMILGAGGGTSGRGCPQPNVPAPCPVAQDNRRQQFLYEVHPIITHGDFRLEFVSTRRLAEYTALSIHDNVVRRRESITATYYWHRRVMIGGEFFHANYSLFHPDVTSPQPHFETASNGGSLFVRPTVYRSDKVRVDAGVLLEFTDFDDRVVPMANAGAGGFYAPNLSERYLGTGHLTWDPNPRVTMEFFGTLGTHRSTGFPALAPPPAQFALTGDVGTRITLKLGRWQPYLSYDFFHSGSPSFPTFGNGAFRSHSFVAGLAYRF